jgi:hypothetical protein
MAYSETDTAPHRSGDTLHNESKLLNSLKDNLFDEVRNHIQKSPKAIAAESAAAFVAGAVMAAATKNPELIGKALAPAVESSLEFVKKTGIGVAAIDWLERVGAPMVDVMQYPTDLHRAQKQLAKNVGDGLVDYTAMTAAGLAGGVAAFKATPELMPKAPIFDPKPSLTLNQKPYEFSNPEKLSTTQEMDVKPDVVKLYEKSFPKEERQPTNEVADLVKKGRILVHTTRDPKGALSTFSFVSMHDETATKFAGLDFIATEDEGRSAGAGSLHLRRLVDDLKVKQPHLTAMTLEMEHPLEPGLAPEEAALRARRSKFYDRLDAPNTNIDYNIIDFEDPEYRGQAQFRAFVFQPDKFNAVRAAHTFMTDQGGYQLGLKDLATLEFNKSNGVWQPPFSRAIGGAVAPFAGVPKDVQDRAKDITNGF